MIRADFHVHTVFSRDGSMQPERLVELARIKHLDCLAITDHNTIQGALEVQRIAPFKVIVGEEVRTTEGEIIGLFLQEEIPPDLTPQETIACIKEQNALAYVPHPFDRMRRSRLAAKSLYAIASELDIVEVWNARTTFESDNELADEFAERYKLLKAGGSDAHIERELGRTYVEMRPFADKEDFLDSLAEANVVGKLSHPIVHFFSSWNKVKKKYLG